MTLSETTFQFVQQLMLRRAAIALDANKQYLVRGRLVPVANRHGLESVDQLVEQLQRAPDSSLADDVVDAMTTNETSFFRDVAPFDTLREILLPALFRSRATTRQLSIWCAACSTGQEPYSVAMLLREHFGSYLDWNIRILGTDLSQTALKQATAGRYGELEIKRGLSEHLATKYFRKQGRYWHARSTLREMVEFRHINLAAKWPPLPSMDVILLRNVMVYFRDSTKRHILRQVRQQLKPDGYLFLGGAETTILLDSSYIRRQHAGFSYYQTQ